MRNLPPFKALNAFEATARLGGVRAAAAELAVTQSAVSHQLANLENHLRAALFHRQGKRLILTDTGRDYLNRIGPVLDHLEEATFEAANHSQVETLTVSAPPSFLAMWLLPRIANFTAGHEDLDLRLLERLTLAPEEETIDCAIEYRLAPDSASNATQILSDQVVPLASPDLIARHSIRSLDDLSEVTLIETERRLISWQAILRESPKLESQRFLSVSYSLHAFEAARLGLGVALGNRYNAQRFIDEGSLAVPFEIPEVLKPRTPKYFLTLPEKKSALKKVVGFSEWLQAEITAIS
ncbi:LysR substrate-binding domain-containing protein [Denitrobaculum tricleocarpae]|uniref:LysR family transcriptional regulator n=1 Tax=Denitrobaculum tricleocarpae TaxID=2591009 RepID=A0A545STM7_9PROT|nr:LysR substrate-binding domain-containing protein [Denitrobaculum tricleocarpae]TQV68322.1 LysR family transcriptional regulator [Denitrobaculum tricleocarpae]